MGSSWRRTWTPSRVIAALAVLLVLFGALVYLGAGHPGLKLQIGGLCFGSGTRDRLLVKFQSGVSASDQGAALNGVAASKIGTGEIKDLGIRTVSVPGGCGKGAISALKGTGKVAFVETDGLLDPQDILPSNPSYPTGYAIGGGAWGWTMTHTSQAWDVTTGSSAVTVAVLDTGIKPSGLNFGTLGPSWNTCSTCGSVYNTSDATSDAGSHGTYVAGVVGMQFNNGVGNTGFCPGCQLMNVQVGTDTGAYMSDIANGLTWATDNGAKVANMSWAGLTDSSTLQSATTYAHNHGVLLTAAAGNSNNTTITYPSGDPYVISVGGTDNTGATKAGDSNYGSWVTIAAPEGNMTSWPSVNGKPGYAPVGGTSLAAPVVAGIAGLILSANTSLTEAQVESAIKTTTVPVNFQVQTGRIDTMAALNSLGITDPQASSVPVNTSTPQVMVETNGDQNYQPLGSAAPQVGQVLLRGQGSWKGSANLSLASVVWTRCTAAGSCATAATAAKYTIQSTDAGDSFKLTVKVSNSLGSTSLTTPLTAAVGGSAPAPSPSPSPVAAPTPSPSPVASPSPAPNPSPSPTSQSATFTGSINKTHKSQSFTFTVPSAGAVTGQLLFSCGGTSLTLSGKDATGAAVSGSGAATFTVNQNAAAGTYTFTVTGSNSCSFSLNVTYP